jgi:hypothetical protein
MPIQHDLEPMETDERFINIEDLGPQAWLEFAEARGWSDGLPLVPPTVEAVGAFTQSVPGLAAPLPPVPPRNVVPTLDSVAANAVMAGCLPQHLPVVVAPRGAGPRSRHTTCMARWPPLIPAPT